MFDAWVAERLPRVILDFAAAGSAPIGGSPTAQSPWQVDADLVDRIVETEQDIAVAQAEQLALIATLVRRRPARYDPHGTPGRAAAPPEVDEFVVDEVAAALHLGRGAAGARLELALAVADRIPRIGRALASGLVDLARVRVVHEGTRSLPEELAVAVDAAVVAQAPEQTTGQLRAAVARAVIAVDPDGADRRHDQACRGRRVCLYPAADGMADLTAVLPAPEAVRAYETLDRLARAAGTPDDPRGMDARRADAMVDLLLGRARVTPATDETPPSESEAGPWRAARAGSDPHGTRDKPDAAARAGTSAGEDTQQPARCPRAPDPSDGAAPRPDRSDGAPPRPDRASTGSPRPVPAAVLHVTVSAGTLLGLDTAPAELAGYGPIPPGLARDLAGDATWRRLLTDAGSGALLDVGRTSYSPPAALADHVRARDRGCRFPGCRQPAHRTDLDHTVAWSDGGGTSATNLACLCRHHHRLRHDDRWRVTLDDDAVMTWTTPTGHVYATTPPGQHGPASDAAARADGPGAPSVPGTPSDVGPGASPADRPAAAHAPGAPWTNQRHMPATDDVPPF